VEAGNWHAHAQLATWACAFCKRRFLSEELGTSELKVILWNRQVFHVNKRVMKYTRCSKL
jgi:hypothetical protein